MGKCAEMQFWILNLFVDVKNFYKNITAAYLYFCIYITSENAKSRSCKSLCVQIYSAIFLNYVFCLYQLSLFPNNTNF